MSCQISSQISQEYPSKVQIIKSIASESDRSITHQSCSLYCLADILILTHIFSKREKKLPVRLIFLKSDSFLEELYKSPIWALFVFENCALPAHKAF